MKCNIKSASKNFCLSHGPPGYFFLCTRKKGHTGKHHSHLKNEECICRPW